MWKSGKIIIFVASLLLFSFAIAAIEPPPAATPNADFLTYAKFIYPFVISVGAILAVIMFIIAGLQMMTASEGQRTAAKERIQNALLGLLLLVGVYLILRTINPDLLNLKIDTAELKINAIKGEDAPPKPPCGKPANAICLPGAGQCDSCNNISCSWNGICTKN